MIDAAVLAAEESLLAAIRYDDPAKRTAHVNAVISSLRESARDRASNVSSYTLSDVNVSTGLPLLDATVTLMTRRASALGISLETDLPENISDASLSPVSEQDLCSLLADMLENAINAVNREPDSSRRILLVISFDDGRLSVTVSDTGIPFPADVLDSMGKRRVTTRSGEGGSGIGLENIYTICQRYGAVFRTDENSPGGYAKAVSVLF